MSGWMDALAQDAATHPQRRRACICCGCRAAQPDGHLRPQAGAPQRRHVPRDPDVRAGIRISEHLPNIAKHMNDMVIFRNMSSREGDHGRATYFLRTAYLPQGAIQYPTLGSIVSKEIGRDDNPLPNFVSIAPFRQFNQAAYSSGFLGPQYAPLLVGDNGNGFKHPAE